jgi:hypothetical protein
MAAASITTAGTGVVAPEVKVITAENTEVVVPHSLVRMSQTLSTLVGDDFVPEAIPLFDVPHSILNMIIEYCNHYENTPVPEIAMPIVTNNIRDIIPDWDANLIDVDQKTLNLLLASADYLGVEPLTKLVYAKIATMIKGMLHASVHVRVQTYSHTASPPCRVFTECRKGCE